MASRRLGLSLGVDIVPFKTCSYNCVYCECGATTKLTTERRSWVDKNKILAEIEDFLSRRIPTNYITFSGSGEPTLNRDIGWLINETKKRTSIRAAVLTNGSLLHDSDVRSELKAADLVIPSLDAVSLEVFRKINRPAHGLDPESIIQGNIEFRKMFKGDLWLEILFCKGINDSKEEVEKIKAAVQRIKPDRVQVGTIVRPPAVEGLEPVDNEFLDRVVEEFGSGAEVIGRAGIQQTSEPETIPDSDILDLVRRRPTTAMELSNAFHVPVEKLLKQLHQMEQQEKLISFTFDGGTFYKAKKQ